MNAGQYGYKDYLNLLVRRKGLFLLVALAATTAGLAFSYLLSEKYEARSTVFIEQNVIADLVKGIAVTPSMDSKVRVLKVSMMSRNLLLEVMEKLGRDERLDPARREAYIESLRQRTTIDIKQKEGVFFVSFRDSSPTFARDFVNTLTQTYIERNTASKREESMEATRFLGEQIDTFRQRIEAVEREIDEYKSKHGLVLSLEEGEVRRIIERAETKLEEYELRAMEMRAQSRAVTAGASGTGQIQELKDRLAGLRMTYTDEHPQVKRLRTRLEALQADPGAYGGAGRDDKENAVLAVKLQSLARLRKQQQEIIEYNRGLLRSIPATRTGLSELVRKKENEQQIYNKLVARYGQSEVSKEMELKNKSVSFRIIDPAILPKSPVTPNRPAIIVGSMGAGVAAAFGLIFLLDMLRGAIRNPIEIEKAGLEIMGIIPRMATATEKRKKAFGNAALFVAAGMYGCLVLGVALSEAMGLGVMDDVLGEPLRELAKETAGAGTELKGFLAGLVGRN